MCKGCAARREWIIKMKRLSYELAAQLLGKPAGPGTGRAGQADRPAATDGRPAVDADPGNGR